MTYRIIYAPRSRRDLEKIHSYLIAETSDRAVADRAIVQLLDAGDALEFLPERFATYPYARRWRMMPVGSYLVFFQIRDKTKCASVMCGTERGARLPAKKSFAPARHWSRPDGRAFRASWTCGSISLRDGPRGPGSASPAGRLKARSHNGIPDRGI